jgi:hypothetical protein
MVRNTLHDWNQSLSELGSGCYSPRGWHRDARDLVRERGPDPQPLAVGKPTSERSIRSLVERYREDLVRRGRDPVNAGQVLSHLAKLPKLANEVVTATSLSDELNAATIRR